MATRSSARKASPVQSSQQVISTEVNVGALLRQNISREEEKLAGLRKALHEFDAKENPAPESEDRRMPTPSDVERTSRLTQSRFASSPEVEWLSMHDIRISDDAERVGNHNCDPVLHSVLERGFETPLTVRKLDPAFKETLYGFVDKETHYEIVDDEAKWICAVALGIKTVPARIIQMSDAEAGRHFKKRQSEKLLARAFGPYPDQPSETLEYLAFSLNNPPAPIYFSVEDLDEIVEGQNLEEHLETIGDGTYLSRVLGHVGWWMSVADTSVLGNGPYEGYQIAFEEQRQRVISLLNDTLSCYAAAFSQKVSWTDGMPGTAGLELLKRYRLLTRYVCAFTREVFPDVNLQRLFDQA